MQKMSKIKSDYLEFCAHHPGLSLIHAAVQQKSEKLLEELIQIGCDVNAVNIRGETPILCANFGNSKIIEYLLVARARVNMCDTRGNTPLQLAILAHRDKYSCLESIYMLLHAGVDINKRNNDNETALDCAVRSRSIEITMVLLQNGAEVNREDGEKSVLTRAAIAEDKKLLKLLLNYGANVDYQNKDKSSPLHFLSWLADYSIISSVIERTSNINRQDDFGYTLLHYASRKGNLILVKLLLEAGANVSVPTRIGFYTALHLAVDETTRPESYNVIRALLEYTANPNDCDILMSTPLLLAIQKCDVKVVNLLSGYGADFTVQDYKGDCALHYAARNPRGDVIIDVLGKCFDVNIKSNDGETALHIGAAFGNIDVCNILLGRGADIRSKDSNGRSPLLAYMEEKKLCLQNGTTVPNESVAFLLISHAAKLEFMNFGIDQSDLNMILCNSELRKHYESCKRELEKLKRKSVCNSVQGSAKRRHCQTE